MIGRENSAKAQACAAKRRAALQRTNELRKERRQTSVPVNTTLLNINGSDLSTRC